MLISPNLSCRRRDRRTTYLFYLFIYLFYLFAFVPPAFESLLLVPAAPVLL